MKSYKFPCGCSWPVLQESTSPDILPLCDFDVELAPDNCPATWALLGRGETKGVFQLESPLGRQWTKKLKPENFEHITALGALLRPGCLLAKDEEDVSMTQHYCRRKNREEEVAPYHPAVDAILFPTYGVLAYQEQAMFLCVAVAAFNEQEADMLRKAIGKKLPEEMAKCKTMFVEGAKKMGILSEDQAAEVFGWIEKSQRYSFNKSHACCYGLTGYECAYIKAHFPLAFFTAWLDQAKNKQDPQQEIFELVNDSKLFDIVVEPPDLRLMNPQFETDGKKVLFGLSDIKGLGDAQFNKLVKALDNRDVSKMSWYEFLSTVSSKITSSVIDRLIQVGALRWMGLTRQRMLSEARVWRSLTDKEQDWIVAENQYRMDRSETNASGRPPFTSLELALEAVSKVKKEGGGCSNKNRVANVQSQLLLLRKPASSMDDSPNWIAWVEEDLLGIAITCTKIDSCDLSQVNVSCKDYLAGQSGYLMFGVEIQTAREVKTKKGKNPGQKMAFLTISDGSCHLDDVICFPEVWKEYGHLLTEGNTVIIQGECDQKKDSQSLLVKKVWQASQNIEGQISL